MYTNPESPKINHGEISHLTNWILDSCATCKMTPDILNFIPGSLAEIEKYIEVADWNFVTAKQKG